MESIRVVHGVYFCVPMCVLGVFYRSFSYTIHETGRGIAAPTEPFISLRTRLNNSEREREREREREQDTDTH